MDKEKQKREMLTHDEFKEKLKETEGMIIPRGLVTAALSFRAQSMVVLKKENKLPLLICGATGVGKSLFEKMFFKFCKEVNPEIKSTAINCAHFTGELAESELFGHVKGAYSGALHDKDGIISKKAKDDLLILDELGELPINVQTKLLRFIDKNEFNKVGSEKTEHAYPQIVGTTNNYKALRDDFKFRFSSFFIPPLYQRRMDVPVYFAVKFPELIPKLLPWEMLTLLAYNWPGNVREIERIGEAVQTRKEIIKFLEERSRTADIQEGLESLEISSSELDTTKTEKLYYDLESNDVDVDLLEKLLNRYGIGLSPDNDTTYYKDFSYDTLSGMYEEDFEFIRTGYFAFNTAYQGLRLFCALFGQAENSDIDILKLGQFDIAKNKVDSDWTEGVKIKKVDFEKLVSSIRKYMLRRISQNEEIDGGILAMKEIDLRRKYYDGLIDLCDGNKRKASDLAGVNHKTFISRYKEIIKKST